MFKIEGVLRKKEVVEYKKKDGTVGHVQNLYIEPEGEIYPVLVKVPDVDKKVGEEGSKVSFDVRIFPYFFHKDDQGNNKRSRGFFDVFVPRSDSKK